MTFFESFVTLFATAQTPLFGRFKPTAKAPVEFAFPLDALQFLFPDLYPEAATTVVDT